MSETNLERIQVKLESVTKKWWFFLILLIIQFIPSYTSESYDPSLAFLIPFAVVSDAPAYNMPVLYPFFKILAILMIGSVFILRNRASRIFSIYVGVSYVLFAFLQSIAFTEEFGLVILTADVLMFLLVAMTWFWEALAQENNLETSHFDISRAWVVPLSILAFWYPIDLVTMMPDFNPLYFVTNMAGLVFCMMTPVYLGVLILFYPNVNIATFRVTSIIGIAIAIPNIFVNFIMFPSLLLWQGILHIPLTVISVYAFILSFRSSAPEN